MPSSLVTTILPFWILGVPLIVAIISLLRLPRHRDIVPPDRRNITTQVDV